VQEIGQAKDFLKAGVIAAAPVMAVPVRVDALVEALVLLGGRAPQAQAVLAAGARAKRRPPPAVQLRQPHLEHAVSDKNRTALSIIDMLNQVSWVGIDEF